ncbi:MAG: DUF4316 domain-containing protein [Lachnospiraceae bacterium]|nr:DUF4316 domain-containing protein [Lachnospiraceae bacterium]
MDIKAWDEIHGEKNKEKLQNFLRSDIDSYLILQLKHTDETAQESYMNYSWLEENGITPQFSHYGAVYAGTLPLNTDPEKLYVKFNIDPPEDYTGHSMSVSDIIALKVDGMVTCFYVDDLGFKELQGFIPDDYLKNAEMAMEDDYGMIDGIINNGHKDSGINERPSVLEKLKETPGQPKPEHLQKAARRSAERGLE